MNHQVSIEAKRKGDSHDNSFIKFIKITNNVKAKLQLETWLQCHAGKSVQVKTVLSKIIHPQQTIAVYPQHGAYTVSIQSGC